MEKLKTGNEKGKKILNTLKSSRERGVENFSSTLRPGSNVWINGAIIQERSSDNTHS